MLILILRVQYGRVLVFHILSSYVININIGIEIVLLIKLSCELEKVKFKYMTNV